MAAEERDQMLHSLDQKVNDLVQLVVTMKELLNEKEDLLLLYGERIEHFEAENSQLRDSLVDMESNMTRVNFTKEQETEQRKEAELKLSRQQSVRRDMTSAFEVKLNAAKAEISKLQDQIRTIEQEHQSKQMTLEETKRQLKAAGNEALIWRKRFIDIDNEWSIKHDASKEVARRLCALIGIVVQIDKRNMARKGVAFGLWKKYTRSSGNILSMGSSPSTALVRYEPNSSFISNLSIADPKLDAVKIMVHSIEKNKLSVEGCAFRHWVCFVAKQKALAEQNIAAEEMAQQLASTRSKLSLLKSHLRNAGLLHNMERPSEVIEQVEADALKVKKAKASRMSTIVEENEEKELKRVYAYSFEY